VAFVAGMVIGWLVAKSNAAATITGLETRLADTAQLISTKQQELTVINRKYEAAQQQLGTVQQANAALNKQVELGQLTLEELKQQLAQTVQELREKQNLLTETVQAKATAATSLQEAGKTIAEMQRREADWQADAARLRAQVTAAKEENATLEANYQATTQRLAEQQQFVEQAQQSLKDAFGALSADALKSNNDSFVALAKATLEEKVTEAKGELEKKHQAIDAVVKPLSESLTKMDEKINVLETKREGAYSQMNTLLDQMKQSTVALDKETRSLVNALKSSTSRGRYGEIALRRLVEFAGMVEHCDFEEQVSTETATGRLRPDMIIRLPESRRIVVDSKVPLAAYLEMFETDDQLLQKQLMDKHIAAIKTYIKELGSKAYWDQFADAPDFVVLFMQIESSFGAALQVWPGMIEEALNNRIIIATPTTLITILRSIGYSWSQLSTIENIEAIRDAAVELYERSATLMEHFTNIGRGLTGTINHYNKAIGSLEAGFLPQGRKINHLAQGFTKKQLAEVTPIDVTAREIVAAPPVTATLPINDSQALNPIDNEP
jgi:DNA recombination protein RmuC